MTTKYLHARSRYVESISRLRHADQADIGDAIDVIDMIRAGDLIHVDAANLAASRADSVDELDATDLLDGTPCKLHFAHRVDDDFCAADLACLQIGNAYLTRDQAVAMLGEEHVRRIEEIETSEMMEDVA